MITIIFVLLLIYFLTRDKNTCKKENFVSDINDVYIGAINCYQGGDFTSLLRGTPADTSLYGLGVLADHNTQYINSNFDDDNHSFMFTDNIKKFRQIKIVLVGGNKNTNVFNNEKYNINRFDIFDKSQTNFAGQGNIAHGDINSNWTITLDINDELFKNKGFYLLSYWNDYSGLAQLKYNVYLSP
jgi:hypothetical protein